MNRASIRQAIRTTARAGRWALGLILVLAACGGAAHAAAAPAVPEIDPGSAAGALTLLIGGALLLTDRLRRRTA